MHCRKHLIFTIIVVLLMAAGIASAASYPAGDANGDGTANVADAVWIINYIFAGGEEPVNFSSADVVNDCSINISDAVRIIAFVFDPEVDHLDKGCTHSETTGICVAYEKSGDTSYVVIEVIDNDLYIHHINPYYNCGLEYNVDYSFNDNEITATEYDTGAPANCLCYFDHLKSVYYDLENGEYLLTLIGINGDTLAIETIVVDDGFGIIGYFDSGCWPENPEKDGAEIRYIYENGILTMEHDSTVFNCGARLVVVFEQASDTLRFFEINISNQFAYCICPFDVSASVEGISPGQYVAEIWTVEPIEGPPMLFDQRIIVLEE